MALGEVEKKKDFSIWGLRHWEYLLRFEILEEKKARESGRRDPKFHLGHLKFKVIIGHPCGDVEQEVCYVIRSGHKYLSSLPSLPHELVTYQPFLIQSILFPILTLYFPNSVPCLCCVPCPLYLPILDFQDTNLAYKACQVTQGLYHQ